MTDYHAEQKQFEDQIKKEWIKNYQNLTDYSNSVIWDDGIRIKKSITHSENHTRLSGNEIAELEKAIHDRVTGKKVKVKELSTKPLHTTCSKLELIAAFNYGVKFGY